MIDVAAVLRATPSFETFCSVESLQRLVETLRADSQNVRVEVAGTSTNGIPIHHVCFGAGRVKALFVAGPHCYEQIGSATVASLMRLLQQRNRALLEADVEWHIVPCIDPDGALLNEGWSQKPFTLDNFMRSYYEQPSQDQVDRSFPIKYKKWLFNEPSREAAVLQALINRIKPDFFYTLHNSAPTGGAWYAISRDIGQKYYQELYALLEQQAIPLRPQTPGGWCAEFGPGIGEFPTHTKFYDFLEQTLPCPEEAVVGIGSGSADYLLEVNGYAVVFVAELTHVKHPSNGSKNYSRENLRQLELRIDADNKFLASVILDEWGKVEEQLNPASPFHRKIFQQLIAVKDQLPNGIWDWNFMRIQHLLFNPALNKTATEDERFSAYMQGRFMFLCNAYCFVRLLKASPQTEAICRVIERLEPIFDEALAELARQVDFGALEIIDCNTLMKAQLGSGLIVLNSVLEAQHTHLKWASRGFCRGPGV